MYRSKKQLALTGFILARRTEAAFNQFTCELKRICAANCENEGN